MKKLLIGLAVLSLSLTTTIAYGAEGNDEYTVLLLHNNGLDGSQTFLDDSWVGNHIITPYGDVQIDTAQYKFGGASGLFDGDGDYLRIPDSNDWYFGSGDFTIDFWVMVNDNTISAPFLSQFFESGNRFYFIWDKDYGFAFGWQDNNITRAWYHNRIGGLPGWTPDNNTWHHIALVRDGGDIYFFADGVSQTVVEGVAISEDTIFGDIPSKLDTGRDWPLFYFNGWIDELRISKGIARWTSDFTPPTNEYGVSTEPPEADAGQDIVACVGDIITLDGSDSYDPDGVIESYTWRSLSDYNQTGICSEPICQVMVRGYSEELIELTVIDNYSTAATDTMIIFNCRMQNEYAPVLARIHNKQVRVGEILEFQVEATDPDGPTLHFSAENLPEGVTFDEDTQIFTWAPEEHQIGAHRGIKFIVSDGMFSDYETITIRVKKPRNNPPRIPEEVFSLPR